MKKVLIPIGLIALLMLLIGALLWLGARQAADDFDYAAAFETPTGADAEVEGLVLKRFAGGTREAVREVLGEPRRCERGSDSERCVYDSAGVQITFIEGKADWIGIPLYDAEHALDPQMLARFGLPVREPDVLSEDASVWRGLGGYHEVRLRGGDGSAFLFVKVRTP